MTRPESRSKIHLIAPSGPPKICGVGDHSALLAAKLTSRIPTLVHSGQIEPPAIFPGAESRRSFDHRFPWTLLPLARSEQFQAGETIFFQYTNFAYGRWGFNPWLSWALREWRKRGLRIATMFHETYMGPPKGIKIRLMRTWQRHFFRRVGSASDLCLFSVEPWTQKYRPWFPNSRVETLAVGSNIPRIPVDRSLERRRLGIADHETVFGVFGGTHPSRLFEWIEAASRRLKERNMAHRILRIGPNAEEVASRLAGSPLLDLGILEPDQVSRGLSCCDVFLSPISDGASSRRGSLLAGLGHGLATISTLGDSSDQLFRDAAGTVLEYAPDIDGFCQLCVDLGLDTRRRAALGRAAAEFHDARFGWDAIADRILDLLHQEPIGSTSLRGA